MEAFRTLLHPHEVSALVKSKYATPRINKEIPTNLQWCYKILSQITNTFRTVQQLDTDLRHAVTIFYLTIESLRCIESDLSFPTSEKLILLIKFNEFLYQPGWTFEGCGEGHEKELLQNFDKVVDSFSALDGGYQKVIQNVALRMGIGMAEYTERGIIESSKDWDKYCYFSKGLEYLGLSQLFYISGIESEWFRSPLSEKLANSIGLLIHKSENICKFKEDILKTKIFWPKEIWSMYTKKLENFKDIQYIQSATECLNHLITNALEHVVDGMEYLSMITNPSILLFVSVPFLVAIETLSLCYDNSMIFLNTIYLRPGQIAQISNFISSMEGVQFLVFQSVSTIEKKINGADPNADKTANIISKIKIMCDQKETPSGKVLSPASQIILASGIALSALYLGRKLFSTP